MEGMGSRPRRRRSFTPEFKAEIVELCQRGDRSAGQVAKDFDLTETAVREWVKQAGRDAGTGDGGLTSEERKDLAESFFSSLKGELIDERAWPTRAGARRAVVEYIAWYNGTRLHSTLGYLSPADYENNHRENVRQVA